MGHALNKILKDIVVKSRFMAGYSTDFLPGWDCHGLPIELQVEKNLGREKETLPRIEIRKRCREYADKYINIQREEFKRLGVFGQWESPYLTMDFSYQAIILREFGKFVSRGLVYKGKKPVHWCASCQTALAEAEVEYADKTSPSVFVKFRVKDPKGNDAMDAASQSGHCIAPHGDVSSC
jgi:isoleucyl-tRNA synthetase